MVRTAVIGSRGYLGRELIRFLLAHPNVQSIAPVTTGEAGKAYGDSVPAFRHRRELTLHAPDSAAVRDADVHFLAVDNEEARRHAEAHADTGATLIDLSRAHRAAAFEAGSPWTYGLSELFPVAKGTKRIANPGCYPTATMLAAAPALRAGLVAPGPLIADGKSGVSGAGATPRGDLHFPEANEAVRAYKVLGHDHLGEIRLATGRLEGHQPGRTAATLRPVRFTPHLVPQNRGLLSTVYLAAKPGVTAEAVKAAYQGAYTGSAFVRVVPEPDTSHVRGSNFADIAADHDADSGLIVARGAIDNLVKGGAGQAIQNMNHAFGFAQTAGLPVAGGGP